MSGSICVHACYRLWFWMLFSMLLLRFLSHRACESVGRYGKTLSCCASFWLFRFSTCCLSFPSCSSPFPSDKLSNTQCMLTASLTIHDLVQFSHTTIHDRPGTAKCCLTSASIELDEADHIVSMFLIILRRSYLTLVSGQN